MKKNILWIVLVIIVLVAGYQFWKIQSGSFYKKSETRVVTADPMTERVINTGKVIGFKEVNNSHAWLGIPYAKAPVGALRWKAPLRSDSWDGTLQALELGPPCSQIGGPSVEVPEEQFDLPLGSEDCLFLNINAPAFTPETIPRGDDRVPVMLWIHGGGNSVGHGGFYNGRVLAAKFNVIVITFNYRLGPFGWFSHPALRGEDTTPEDRSGNYGTMDIIRALTWVQNNIAGFGGNPDNVTVLGESAGAVNTLTMLLSPKAKGLFHRAISQTGFPWTATMAKAENYRDAYEPGHASSSREVINRLLIADGIASDRQAAKRHQDQMSNQEIAEYLRGKSNAELLSVYESEYAGMIFLPMVFQDGEVLLKGEPLDLFRDRANFNEVPVILGSTKDEYKMFMSQDPVFVNQYFGFYFRIKDPEFYELYARYNSEAWKAIGVDEIATVLSKIQGPAVYAYRFDWDEEPVVFGMDLGLLIGSSHGMEISFMFNDFDVGFFPPPLFTEESLAGREALSNSMASYWTEFAFSGSPGRGRDGKEVAWKAWDPSSPESDKFIILDTPEDQGIRMSSDIVTREDLKARLLADTGFLIQEKHCEAYANIFGNSDFWDDQEYETLGQEGCGDYPKEKFIRH